MNNFTHKINPYLKVGSEKLGRFYLFVIKQTQSSTPKHKNKKGHSFFSRTVRLTTKEQTFFAKRLAFLTNAGVPTLESLMMLKEQSRSRSFARILEQVIVDFSSGQFLSTSLRRYEHIFGDFAINLIRVAEASGTLSQNLDYLAEELKKRYTLKRKVIGAFVYPALITVATVGITGFLMLYLFPKITPIFASLHVELPLSTQIVMATSNFLRAHGLWIILNAILISIVVVLIAKKVRRFRFAIHYFILKLPIVGNMFRNFNLANICRTLGLLLKSGVTVSDALPITAETTHNLVYKKELQELSAIVKRGEKISTALLKKPKLFPPVLSQMIAVGERSGNLSDTLTYLAELYEHEVEEFSKDLSTIIEPALMIFMGILVGFVAISIITPIYGITQSIHR